VLLWPSTGCTPPFLLTLVIPNSQKDRSCFSVTSALSHRFYLKVRFYFPCLSLFPSEAKSCRLIEELHYFFPKTILTFSPILTASGLANLNFTDSPYSRPFFLSIFSFWNTANTPSFDSLYWLHHETVDFLCEEHAMSCVC